jgi:uncharacterized protein YggT (Ycf19 family)
LVSWPLTYWELLPRSVSLGQRTGQAMLVGLGSYLAGKFLIVGALALNLVSSYVFFGRHPFWPQLEEISRRLLAPLRFLPLRISRFDFAPLVGIALVLLVAAGVENGIKTPPRKDKAGRIQPPLVNIPGLVGIYQRIAK